MKRYQGQCFCGFIRYSTTAKPSAPHLCHCHMCQRLSGAPVVNWVTFSLSSFKFEGAEPKFHRSSKSSQRGFCPECGSQVCAIDDGDNKIYITVTTLDDKENECFTPTSESFKGSSPSWMSSKK